MGKRIVAGPLVRLACERHLRDLKEGPARGLKWDWPAAKRVIDFFAEVLRLDKGKPFILEPSQVFIVGSLFGWKLADGYRRFRVAYVEIGKGNGKSPLAGGIGLYMLGADDEERAEVYAAAVDKDQAQVPFRDAVAMVNQSIELDSRITRSGGPGKEWNLAYHETGSFFRPISSESQGRGKSGPRPHFVILDEVHEHPTSAMVDFMRAGTKGRKQALIFMITNSGVMDPSSVCYQYHNYAERLLTGQDANNDSMFFYVCGLDKGDSWTNPKVWPKANPLLGVSIQKSYLEELVKEAKGMPSKQSIVRRLNCCEWVESLDPFIDPEVWRANGSAVDVQALKKRSCVGALDLSGKNDLTALILEFDADQVGIKDVLCFFWTPGETLRERSIRDRAPYQQWVDDDYLIATPGPTIDYAFVARKLAELAAEYDIRAVGFDPWRIDDLRRELEAIGADVTLKEHGQGFKEMDPAIEALEDDLLEKRIRHGNHPVLTWCINNVRVEKNAAALRMFSKKKATGRIDGAVSLAMASNLSASFVGEPEGSYEVTVI